MFVAKEQFYFIDKREGTTKEGERYLIVNVLSKDSKNFNFITKDKELINAISPLNLQKFAPVKLHLGFLREYNRDKRSSYWTCNLIGIE